MTNKIRSGSKNKLVLISITLTIVTFLFSAGLILFILKGPALFTTAPAAETEQDIKASPATAEKAKKAVMAENLPPSLISDLHPVYEIDAELKTERHEINGTLAVSFDNPGTEQILFYLYQYEWSPMKIREVRFPAEKTEFTVHDRAISFANKFRKRERLTVEIDFTATVPQSGTRFGEKDGVWLLTHWHPMLGVLSANGEWLMPQAPIGFGDPFYYQHADYLVHFTAPGGIKWVTSGTEEQRNGQQGRERITWKAEKTLNFALAGSNRYSISTIKSGNTQINVALLQQSERDKVMSMAERVFSAYTNLFGTLAAKQVAIAETAPGTNFAMEYANLAIYSVDLHQDHTLEHWLPHEIAHLWWYNTVSTLEPRYGWIDEGLADASVAAYIEAANGKAAAQHKWEEYQKEWQRLKVAYPTASLDVRLAEFTDYFQFKRSWYAKSALLFHELEQQIGEDAYRNFLKLLQQHFVHKIIGPEHLDAALQAAVGGEVHFFRENLIRQNQLGFRPPVISPYLAIVLDGMELPVKPAAREIAGIPYLPLRGIAEAADIRVKWDEDSNEAQLDNGTKTISFRPVVKRDGRALAPLPLFVEEFGWQAEYDQESKRVTIVTPAKP